MENYAILTFLSVYLILQTFSFAEEFNDEDIPIVEGYHVTEEEDVLVLTDNNFYDIVLSKPIILVEFYAPWCGHCQTLAPEFAKAAGILKTSSPSIPLAKVDATKQEFITKKYEITSFPTLLIFKQGEKIEYDGPRTAQGIVDFMKREADSNYKPPPSAVITLTNENFDDIVNKKDLILVEFYAPWCGHCKRLTPEYERAARSLSIHTPVIYLGKVDATISKELATKYSVTGYPTLFIFRNGKHVKYDGPREEAGIVAYMKEQAKPPSLEIISKKQLDNSINSKSITVAGFFKDAQDELYQEYITAGNLQRKKYQFIHTFSDNVISQAAAKTGMIALYHPEQFLSKYEPVRHELALEEDASHQDILNFFKSHRIPLVGQRSRENLDIYSSQHPLVVVYYDVDLSFEHKIQTQLIRKQVLEVAKDYSGTITFSISNEEDFQEDLKDLGLEDSGEDVNVGFYVSPGQRYAMEPTDDFSSTELRAFIQKVLKGKLKRYIKSAKEPKDNNGPVLTVVGTTFDDIVTSGNDGKDILLEFYAPWCQHCNRFAPTYEKLANYLTNSHGNSLKVAKMDATSNDVPEEYKSKIDGYPTLLFASHKTGSSGKPKIIKYEKKSWAFHDVIKFVEERTSGSSKDEL